MRIKDLFFSKAKRYADGAVPPKIGAARARAGAARAPGNRPRNIGRVIRLDPETMLRTSVESEDK
jgi:hypothetical protein